MPDATRADEFAGTRLEWVAGSCRLLQATGDEFAQTRPFEGLTLATAIHLEPKTAALLLTLKRGGATVVSTGNLNGTQPETLAYLRAHGVDVVGEQTKDPRSTCRVPRPAHGPPAGGQAR